MKCINYVVGNFFTRRLLIDNIWFAFITFMTFNSNAALNRNFTLPITDNFHFPTIAWKSIFPLCKYSIRKISGILLRLLKIVFPFFITLLHLTLQFPSKFLSILSFTTIEIPCVTFNESISIVSRGKSWLLWKFVLFNAAPASDRFQKLQRKVFNKIYFDSDYENKYFKRVSKLLQRRLYEFECSEMWFDVEGATTNSAPRFREKGGLKWFHSIWTKEIWRWHWKGEERH